MGETSDFSSLDDFAASIGDTISGGDAGGQGQPGADTGGAETTQPEGQETIDTSTVANTEGQDANVDDTEVTQDGQGQESKDTQKPAITEYDKAVEHLKKFLKKEQLTPEEIQAELSKSYLLAPQKIERLVEDNKVLVDQAKKWEEWYQSNNIEVIS